VRKLIIANFALAFLVIGVFILGYYFLQYPDDFNISRYIRRAEWQSFGLIFLGLIIGAVALSFLPINNYSQKRKSAIFLAALQGLFLLFLIFQMIDTYKQNKTERDNLVAEYREKADADIKKGFIEIEYAGGLELLNEQELKMRAVEDSVRGLYGFSYRNSGCFISTALVVAQEEYENLTKPYLNMRNEPGWEKRMEQQIEELRNKYR
jgi:Na+/H+-translocating membrane pyrophosphatase